jgi:hypothetical protein
MKGPRDGIIEKIMIERLCGIIRENEGLFMFKEKGRSPRIAVVLFPVPIPTEKNHDQCTISNQYLNKH